METIRGHANDRLVCLLPRGAVSSWTLGIFVFHTVAGTFQMVESFNLAVHLRNFPKSGVSKEQSGKQPLPTYWQMLPLVAFNQVFVLLPLMLLIEWTGLAFHRTHTRPTLGSELAAAAVMTAGHDVLFYVFHRFVLHSKQFRFLRHDIHHTSKAHCGVSAMYMHPADFVLEIAVPYLVPLAIVSTHVDTVVIPSISLAAGCIGGVVEHSGFDLTGFQVDTATHLEHHKRGYCSFSDGFGSPGAMDSLFGTSCIGFVPSISALFQQSLTVCRKISVKAKDKNS